MSETYWPSNDFHYVYHPFELVMLKWEKPRESFNFFYKDMDGNEQKIVWTKGEKYYLTHKKIIYETTFDGMKMEVDKIE